MCSRNHFVVLVQKRLRVKAVLGAVEGSGGAAVDLNCVGAAIRPNRPIDLHVRACLFIRTGLCEAGVCHYPEIISQGADT